MADHDFPTVRKNLNILSVVVLLLAFSRAEINKFNFLGLDVSLEGSKFYIALFVLYLYFIWRYWTKANFHAGFLAPFYTYFLESEEGVKKRYPFFRVQGRFFDENPAFKEAYENDKNYELISLTIRSPSPRDMRNLSFHIAFSKSARETKTDITQSGAAIKLKVSRLFVWWVGLRYSIKYDKFGDYVFPLIPVVVNVTYFFSAKEWQGSFFQLFN